MAKLEARSESLGKENVDLRQRLELQALELERFKDAERQKGDLTQHPESALEVETYPSDIYNNKDMQAQLYSICLSTHRDQHVQQSALLIQVMGA